MRDLLGAMRSKVPANDGQRTELRHEVGLGFGGVARLRRSRTAELSHAEGANVLRPRNARRNRPEFPAIARGTRVAVVPSIQNGGVLSMRRIMILAALAVCSAPAAAHAQSPKLPLKTEIQGFGGMTVGTAQFGSAVTP